MALTISQFGTGSTTTAVTSIAISSLTASVGDMFVVAVASDNSATGGASPISSVTDSASNTYTSQINATNDPGAENEGVSLRVFTSVLTSALSSGTVTVNFNTSTSNANVLMWRVEASAGDTIEFLSASSTTGNGTTTSRSVVNALPSAVVFGFAATELGGAFTADTDTNFGSWSSNYVSNTASETPLASQYKIPTEIASQTYNSSWASTADFVSANLYIGLNEKLRLYLPSSSGASPISPAVSSGWEKSSDLDRIIASKAKTSTAMTTVTATKAINNTAYDVARRQYVYGPLAAGTLQGSFLSVVSVSESATAADASSQLVVKVVSNDGSILRGTAVDLSDSALVSEWPTTLTSRYFPVGTALATLSPVTIQSGDYLVLEFGVRGREAAATERTFSWRFGDAAASDRSLGQSSANDNNPFALFFGTSLATTTFIAPGVATLTLTRFAPAVTAESTGPTTTTVTPPSATLVTTSYAPTVTATANRTATPSAAAISTTSHAPTVTATANQTATPSDASLTTTSYAPDVTATDNQTVTVGVAALTISAEAPVVSATANVSVEPVAASLTITADSPAVAATANVSLSIGTLALAFTMEAPAASTTANQVAAPASATLATTSFAPTITATANKTVTPAAATLSLTVSAPVLKDTVAVGAASLAVTAFAPSVAATANQTATPAAAVLLLTALQPTVTATANLSVSPATAALLLTALIPDVVAEFDLPGFATVSLLATGLATMTLSAPTATVGFTPTGRADLTLS